MTSERRHDAALAELATLREGLRAIGINPSEQRFTVKLTGGPDGDVAGNAIRILAQSCMRKEVGNLELDQLFLEREKLNAEQRLKKMRMRGLLAKKSAVTAEDVAKVELDKGDKEMIAQMEEEAEARIAQRTPRILGHIDNIVDSNGARLCFGRNVFERWS